MLLSFLLGSCVTSHGKLKLANGNVIEEAPRNWITYLSSSDTRCECSMTNERYQGFRCTPYAGSLLLTSGTLSGYCAKRVLEFSSNKEHVSCPYRCEQDCKYDLSQKNGGAGYRNCSRWCERHAKTPYRDPRHPGRKFCRRHPYEREAPPASSPICPLSWLFFPYGGGWLWGKCSHGIWVEMLRRT